ncbi:MAG: uncharacterized protein KVP18_003237 [Porospora cf. gigantea A]|uniref:uncharacterized protein n=1 Tax=Porospora cf. gigantea A TaxID=2853593 RepID=UPI00355A1782|nr:MAG: hypothetical protein KVP18_003237 [Porospora cf. gigantea A]
MSDYYTWDTVPSLRTLPGSTNPEARVVRAIQALQRGEDWNEQREALLVVQMAAKEEPDLLQGSLLALVKGIHKCCSCLRSVISVNAFVALEFLVLSLGVDPLIELGGNLFHTEFMVPVVEHASRKEKRFVMMHAYRVAEAVVTGEKDTSSSLSVVESLAALANHKSSAVADRCAALLSLLLQEDENLELDAQGVSTLVATCHTFLASRSGKGLGKALVQTLNERGYGRECKVAAGRGTGVVYQELTRLFQI